MDFRAEAAAATLGITGNSSGAAVAGLSESGCVPLQGGRRIQALVELPLVFISTICLLCSVLALPLSWMGVIPRRVALPALVIVLALMLSLRMAKALVLRLYLSSRSDSLLKALPELPSKSIG